METAIQIQVDWHQGLAAVVGYGLLLVAVIVGLIWLGYRKSQR